MHANSSTRCGFEETHRSFAQQTILIEKRIHKLINLYFFEMPVSENILTQNRNTRASAFYRMMITYIGHELNLVHVPAF